MVVWRIKKKTDVQFNGLFFLVLLSLLKYTYQQGTTFRLYKKTYNILIARIVSALAGFHGTGSSMLVELEVGDVCFLWSEENRKTQRKTLREGRKPTRNLTLTHGTGIEAQPAE